MLNDAERKKKSQCGFAKSLEHSESNKQICDTFTKTIQNIQKGAEVLGMCLAFPMIQMYCSK
jgi:hypothetical protein